MFGFGKKKEPEKKKSKIDKLVMGAIVGGAIGSIIGMSIAPQKGKDTREYIAQKGKDALEKGKEVTHQLQLKLEEEKDLLSEKAMMKKGLFARMKDKLFRRKLKKQLPLKEHDLKKIPHEEITGNE